MSTFLGEVLASGAAAWLGSPFPPLGRSTLRRRNGSQYEFPPTVDTTADEVNASAQQALDGGCGLAPLEKRSLRRVVHAVSILGHVVVKVEPRAESADEEITGSVVQVSQPSVELAGLRSGQIGRIVR